MTDMFDGDTDEFLVFQQPLSNTWPTNDSESLAWSAWASPSPPPTYSAGYSGLQAGPNTNHSSAWYSSNTGSLGIYQNIQTETFGSYPTQSRGGVAMSSMYTMNDSMDETRGSGYMMPGYGSR